MTDRTREPESPMLDLLARIRDLYPNVTSVSLLRAPTTWVVEFRSDTPVDGTEHAVRITVSWEETPEIAVLRALASRAADNAALARREAVAAAQAAAKADAHASRIEAQAAEFREAREAAIRRRAALRIEAEP